MIEFPGMRGIIIVYAEESAGGVIIVDRAQAMIQTPQKWEPEECGTYTRRWT